VRVGNESGISDLVVVRSSLLAKESSSRAGPAPGHQPARGGGGDWHFQTVGPRPLARRADPLEQHRRPAGSGAGDSRFHRAALFARSSFPPLQPSSAEGISALRSAGLRKTLLGKATAHNLRLQSKRRRARIDRSFFLNIKGPEILNMWLGESERQVRDLFAQCREKPPRGSWRFYSSTKRSPSWARATRCGWD